jgi:Phage integrase, N-terminal SAM-like domain
VIESDEEQGRDLSRLVVARAGRLVTTGDAHEPYQVVGPGGEIVEPVSVFLRDLLASGKSESTLRSYSVDLLRWWRFLDAVDVQWDRASRAEAQDFSCWIWNPPMPLLFQRSIGSENRAFTPSAVRKLLIGALAATGPGNQAQRGIPYSDRGRVGCLRRSFREAESLGRHVRPRVRVTLRP